MTREEALRFLRGEVRRHIPDADDETADRVIAKAAAMPRDIEPAHAIAKAANSEVAQMDGHFGVLALGNPRVNETRLVSISKGDPKDDIFAAMRVAGFTPDAIYALGGTDEMIERALARTVQEARSGHRG